MYSTFSSQLKVIICMYRSACGSNQPEQLSIEYPLPSSCETPPPTPSQPEGKRKREGKAEGKAKTKKTKGMQANKKKPLVAAHSPAICTRSKTPESPAMSTRSKRKILE